MLKKILIGFIAIIVVVAVGLWAVWPENFVVKGPMLAFITGEQAPTPSEEAVDTRFKLPSGFKMGLFAENVENARMLAFTETGDLVVSSRHPGTVTLLWRDMDGDGVSDGRQTLFSGLKVPAGIALFNGYIYVGETHRIIRAPYDAYTRTVGDIEVVFEGLPPGGNHSTRTIGFGPDGWLYVSIGSSCNVCIEDHPYRAAMLRMRSDGSGASVYATGLRNTVGFDWQPGTGKLYGTDNGRDLLGDDIPHCEINLIEEGAFYGWPYTYDNYVVDPDLGKGHEEEIRNSRIMVHGLGAHVAPLGIRFLDPQTAPEGYADAALVALHGSWNRSTLSGYKVVSLHFNVNGDIEEKDFLTGFEVNEDVIGRPVDIAQGPDGAIYVSDDYSGSIYRIVYGNAEAGSIERTGTDMSAADPLAGYTDIEISKYRAEGADLFAQNACAECHVLATEEAGDSGKKALSNLIGRFDVEGVITVLDIPPGPMPRADLTADERETLAIYLLSVEAEAKGSQS